MSKSSQTALPDVPAVLLPLEDLGALQLRYEPMPLADRARAVLKDAKPAMETASRLLEELAKNPDAKRVFDSIRTNPALSGKMRASDAKNILMDAANDFVAATRNKMDAWQKTMERISQGEGVVRANNNEEHISGEMSVAMALLSVSSLDNYLSIIQVAFGELAKIDASHASKHQSSIVKLRRCATLISDYDHASSLRSLIH